MNLPKMTYQYCVSRDVGVPAEEPIVKYFMKELEMRRQEDENELKGKSIRRLLYTFTKTSFRLKSFNDLADIIEVYIIPFPTILELIRLNRFLRVCYRY